ACPLLLQPATEPVAATSRAGNRAGCGYDKRDLREAEGKGVEPSSPGENRLSRAARPTEIRLPSVRPTSSPGRTRTSSLAVNSRPLYPLSYKGMTWDNDGTSPTSLRLAHRRTSDQTRPAAGGSRRAAHIVSPRSVPAPRPPCGSPPSGCGTPPASAPG